MKTAILIIQLISSLLLIGLILMQNSKGGLTSGFVASDGYRTKRGAEKIVFRATIVISVLFFIISVIGLLIK